MELLSLGRSTDSRELRQNAATHSHTPCLARTLTTTTHTQPTHTSLNPLKPTSSLTTPVKMPKGPKPGMKGYTKPAVKATTGKKEKGAGPRSSKNAPKKKAAAAAPAAAKAKGKK